MNTPSSNLALIRAYLSALEAGAVDDELARFFCSDVVQVEHPNKLNPGGGRSDLRTILARAKQGKALLKSQSYDVCSHIAEGSRVAVEALWTGVLAVPFGALAAGDRMRAHFAMFFEIVDGRIAFQRNYDCFETW